MTEEPPKVAPLWKRVLTLTLWIYLMTPIGLWKLYKDKTLSSTIKWRILIYLFFVPTMIYVIVSVSAINASLQRYLP